MPRSGPPGSIAIEGITVEGGYLQLESLPQSRLRVTAIPTSPDTFIARRTCETGFSLRTVEAIAAGNSITWVCEDLARHSHPDYVGRVLGRQLQAYLPPGEAPAHILDFGCGSGSSTIFLARMFPRTQVTGVDLEASKLELAKRIARESGVENAHFLVSPSGDSLPPQIGPFDAIMLSAVYEHLLPNERLTLLPLLWSALKPAGTLFINQTPHRWSPFEHHTTGLWFINYLPDGVAHYLATHYSREAPEENSRRNWQQLLRAGIRGGSEREVLSNIRRVPGARPVVLEPREGDRAAQWLAATNPRRLRAVKYGLASLFRLTDRLFGVVPSTHLEMAIRKDA